MLILKEKDVEELLTLMEVIDVNEEVFKKQSLNQVQCPNRIILPLTKDGPPDERCYFKPSLVNDMGLGLKIVSAVPSNSNRNIPTVPATIVIVNQQTGVCESIISATYITGVRTAAGSAVSCRYLSRDNSKVLSVFGSGLQAKLHIKMILLIRPSIDIVYLKSRSRENIENLIKELQTTCKNVKFQYNDSTKDMVSQADIIVTATNTKEPLFDGNDIKQGTHICAVGSSLPGERELDTTTITRSKVILDDFNSAGISGDISIPLKEGSVERTHFIDLGDLLTEKFENPRSKDPNSITLFKSSGIAIQDIATASLVYNRAKKLNKGIYIDMNN